MNRLQQEFLRVKLSNPKAKLPVRSSAGAAGYDLHSCDDITLPARQKVLIRTGVHVAIPSGFYGRVAPRSGLAVKYGLDVGAGVIDCDYRDEIGVILFNHSDQDYSISSGERIAQLIIEAIACPEIVEVDILDNTERGMNGFGSTGKF